MKFYDKYGNELVIIQERGTTDWGVFRITPHGQLLRVGAIPTRPTKELAEDLAYEYVEHNGGRSQMEREVSMIRLRGEKVNKLELERMADILFSLKGGESDATR